MNDIIVLDNIISEKHQNEIEKMLLSEEINWRVLPTPAPNIFLDDELIFNTWQLTHAFYMHEHGIISPGFELIAIPILHKLKTITGIDYSKRVGKIKVNTLFKNINSNYNNYNVPHVDNHNDNYKSLLYYVNDSDGDTFIFNESYKDINLNPRRKLTLNRRITPKKGTAILFNSNQYHASSSPNNTERRLVINFVFADENLI